MIEDSEYNKFCDDLRDDLTKVVEKACKSKEYTDLKPEDKFSSVIEAITALKIDFLVSPFKGDRKRTLEALAYGKIIYENFVLFILERKE